jgi:hypothetical protein
MEKTLCIFPYLLIADLKVLQNLCKFIFQNSAISQGIWNEKEKRGETGSALLLVQKN